MQVAENCDELNGISHVRLKQSGYKKTKNAFKNIIKMIDHNA